MSITPHQEQLLPLIEAQGDRPTTDAGAWDLLLISLLTAAMLALSGATAGAMALARLVVSLPVLCFGLGHVLSTICFPDRGQLRTFERITLGLTLSVALIVFACLTLYALEMPIRHDTLVLWLTIWLVGLTAVAVVRRSSLPSGQATPRSTWIQVIGRAGHWDRLSALLIAALVAAGLAAVGYRALSAAPGERYTEFAIIDPRTGRADAPPLVDGEAYTLEASVTNREQGPRSYVLRASSDNGYTLTTRIGTLEPGGTWAGPISVPAELSGGMHALALRLFLEGDTMQPYRELHLWLE